MKDTLDLKVTIENVYGTYREIADRCRTTVNMDKGTKEVSEDYMRRLYRSEHSPIRLRSFLIRVENVPSWIATHLRTHKDGINDFGHEYYISTQRDDRTEIKDRDKVPQGALVTMELHVNAQALINISRKRLCRQAHIRTIKVWRKILEQIKEIDKALYEVCVPECVYRGFCPEMKSCGYVNTEIYKSEREKYIR